jgi:hypothetical protein
MSFYYLKSQNSLWLFPVVVTESGIGTKQARQATIAQYSEDG